jgi:hypothetical protein
MSRLDLLVSAATRFLIAFSISSPARLPLAVVWPRQKALRIGSYAASFGYTSLDDLYKYQIAREIGRL